METKIFLLFITISGVFTGRTTRHSPDVSASQQISQNIGYKYPVPGVSFLHPQSQDTFLTEDIQPISSASQQLLPQVILQASAATPNITQTGADEHHHHNPVIEAIDVACGKERMTVRVKFDQIFNGIIYTKGHYNVPVCQFVTKDSGQKTYQFDLKTGECGVAFIDAGLKDGGQAYVEGLLVIINEPGVQEAWDAARKIRCLWEGNLEQTVTFPLSLNMLDTKLLTFSGDTANVGLEIQAGTGPRASAVQGLVGIGDRLTAVVTVQGDNEFDLLVRNCVATDGTENNRIVLTDSRGCAVKPKLMGGWKKEKSGGNLLAFSELSAFKFPDVMDLFLECTVALCKGDCEECPNYLTLHVPNHDDNDSSIPIAIEVTSPSLRSKRYTHNETVPEELKLRQVVHVVGPDDLPEFSSPGATVYGDLNGSCHSDCFVLVGIVSAITLFTSLTSVVMFVTFRRRNLINKY